MRAIANYAMLGRRQAVTVVLLSGLFPPFYFISAAVVALVALRRDSRDASVIWMWAMFPAVAHLVMFSNPWPILLIPAATLLALILRYTEDWQKVLIAAAVTGLAAGLCVPLFSGFVIALDEFAEQLAVALNTRGEGVVITAEELSLSLQAMFGTTVMVVSLLSLMLARWWQACEVNPGGFRQEFHALKLTPAVAVFCMLVAIAGLFDALPVRGIGSLAGMVLVIAGIAVGHGLIAAKKMGTAWIVLFYVATLFFIQGIIVLGFIDSLVDFRQRYRKAAQKRIDSRQPEEDDDENTQN